MCPATLEWGKLVTVTVVRRVPVESREGALSM
jgi:hypothetical protein